MSYQIGDRIRVIEQDITGEVVEVWGEHLVIEDDDSEFAWPENRLEYRFSEVEPAAVDYFCLSSLGNLFFLGAHEDFDSAEDHAINHLELEPIWIFDRKTANNWVSVLKEYGVKA